MLVDVTLPHNASIHATNATIERLDAVLTREQDVERFSSYVGRGAIRFYLPLNVQLNFPFFGQIVVVTKSIEARERLRARLKQVLAEQFPAVVGRVYPLELGPPVGWPLQYRVLGEDLEMLRTIANELAEVMGRSADTRQVNFEWMEPQRDLRVAIDQDEARRLGLSSAVVASLLNSVISGSTVTQIRDDIYLVDVVLRQEGGQSLSIDTLRTLQVLEAVSECEGNEGWVVTAGCDSNGLSMPSWNPDRCGPQPPARSIAARTFAMRAT